jgi:hypothetical protein
MGKWEMLTEIWSGNLKIMNPMRESGVDGKIMLKSTLRCIV